MSTENRLFGARIRAERARLRLTQAQVAVMGRVSKTTQVAYEADVHVPDADYICNLAHSGFDGVYLLTGLKSSDFASAAFNWQLLGVLLEAVQEWSNERGVRIPSAKISDLMRTLYDQFEHADEIDTVALGRTLRLVA